ncbi:MAG TPA: phosphoglycerate kinase, partial [Solirubrobacteraceae bacterium]
MRTLDDLDLDGVRALVRVDFNVPLGKDADGSPTVADDTRIRAALETIEELRRAGASIVLVSHLGRPEGRREADLSLAPVVERLRELTDAPVTLAPTVVDGQVEALAEALAPGELLVLENVRFEPGETSNDPVFARALAGLADVYVDDAFGAAHRAHASTEGVAHLLPSAAGRLLEREVRTLSKILEAPPRPLVAVIGGAKVADKIGVIDRFLDLADVVIIGGAMCFPFLCAQGHAVGDSLCGDEDVEHARRALAKATDPGRASVSLPTDLVIGKALAADAEHRVLDGIEVPEGWMGLDIGPASAERYAAEIAKAGSVFWNGPMGAFELQPFAAGTRRVAEAVAQAPGVTV